MAKLGEIFDLQMGKTPSRNKSNYWTDGQYSWVSIADLGTYQKYVGATKEEISEVAVRESGIKSVPANTVIMSFKLSLGKTAITKEEVYTNEAIMAFIPTGKYDVLPDYFYHLFTGKDWSKETNRAVMGATLNKAMLSEISVPVPLIDEQRKIAAVLDKVSDLIAKRRQQLDKLDELIKARFVEMFGKRFPECTLLSLCNIIDYRGKTPQKVDFGLPFITAKNIRMHRMVLEPKEYISKETYDKVMVRGFPKEGDVVFTTEAPLGNVCRIPHFDTEFYVGQRIVTLQTTALHPAYLEYALDTEEFKKKIAEKSSGSTVAGIRVRLLEQLTIPVPPLDLQNQFAAFVEQTEKTKTTISRSLEKLETLKKALMQEYFG
ncbi:restriction endonuclease subunit S [Negativibacillus massiliensis]|uniref:restriction endonuclease subunit S n=1 Tax=Negativibacillus massiliensis TaxID=1871035 RepID=UPI000977987E|nr:restriction endonuclease subunit S [Negativibacillus massiliensis]